MHFANIRMTRQGRFTVGDEIQLLAIEHLYQYMGIDPQSILSIPFNELATYDGEYAVLPISFPLYGYSHDAKITQYSDKIIPVFLGMAILTDHLTEEEVCYLKNYEPVGCRDQFTLQVLRKYRIKSYLNGCITATLPRRDPSISGEKIFCVDVPDSFRPYIPQELLAECEFVNHVFMTDECPQGSRAKAIEVYDRYRREAKLVITNRLHAALPCAAMGIPVILAKEKPSYRFEFLSGLLPVYSAEDYASINWHPQPVEFEELKQKLLQQDAKRIRQAYEYYKDIYEISETFEKPQMQMNYFEAITDTVDHLTNTRRPDESFDFCLWGITQSADMIGHYIFEHYPNARLLAVLDRREGVDFLGCRSVNRDWLRTHPETFCFVCAPAIMPEAKVFFEEIGQNAHLLCWQDQLPR